MDTVRRLIGITGTNNAGKRATAKFLAEAMDLRQWELQQPILDAIAALTGLHRHQLHGIDWDTPIPMLKTTVRELAGRLHLTTRLLNTDFLTAHLVDRMHRQTGSYLYSGDLVLGISTPIEAAWVRAKGGLLVHLVNGEERSGEVNALPEDIVILQGPEPDKSELVSALAQVRHAWLDHERAA